MQLTRDVLIEAEQSSHPFTLSYALTTAGCLVPLWIGNLEMAEQSISRLKAHAGTHGLRSYQAAALGFEGRLYAARADTAVGEMLLRRSVAELRDTRVYMFYTVFLSQLAEIMASAGEIDDAIRSDALSRARTIGGCRKRCGSRVKSCLLRAKGRAPRRRTISANRWSSRNARGR